MGEQARQFVQYSFYKVDPAWARLSSEERARGQREFQAACEAFCERMPLLKSYSLVGIRGDVDFLLWKVSEDLPTLQELETSLRRTGLGRWLHAQYVYLAMTRGSIYVQNHRHEGQEGTSARLRFHGAPYLFVYPFVKTRAWYALPVEERRRMMAVHFKVGHKYPSARIHTAYSFGLDDQEFVLAFEADSPGEFLDLVMELRETEASSYTLRDTPIFTCLRMDLPQVLQSIGG